MVKLEEPTESWARSSKRIRQLYSASVTLALCEVKICGVAQNKVSPYWFLNILYQNVPIKLVCSVTQAHSILNYYRIEYSVD